MSGARGLPDALLIGAFASEAGEPPPAWHVVQPAPMPKGGKQPGAGHPHRVPGEKTRPLSVNVTDGERERYRRLAAAWGCGLGEAMRRAADDACERVGIDGV